MSIIIFPIFEACSKYTLDTYWQELFAEFASNKFPKGIKYDSKKHTLYVKKENGLGHTALLLPKEPEKAYTKIINLIKSNLNLRSQRDLYFLQEEFEQTKKDNIVITNVKEWKKIKSKVTKERLLFDFLYSLVEKYSLNMKEKKHLFSVITLSFLFKTLISDDIVYEGGRVINIKGLQFDKLTRSFSIVNSRKKKTCKTIEKNISNDSFSAICHKYVKDETERMLHV
jgi:hypothetical protein